MSKYVGKLQCTTPERMEKLLEIEKAAKWLVYWTKIWDNLEEKSAELWRTEHGSQKDLKMHKKAERADNKRIKAFDRLNEVISK